ncbi:hypothetical protein [Saccharopolyspora antimicrobica]|uniref:hypothetical protein n=1 Tax=Saccharopolyspora antimicrobica TaxID=455193 RepID=UPI000B8119E5|nr:hypothetical protein [Saccharopolyspora antimicrobica]
MAADMRTMVNAPRAFTIVRLSDYRFAEVITAARRPAEVGREITECEGLQQAANQHRAASDERIVLRDTMS